MITLRAAAVLSLALLIALSAAACSSSDTPAAAPSGSESDPGAQEGEESAGDAAAPDGVIRIADTGEGFQWINNQLLKLIAEGAYDLTAEIVPVTPENLQQALLTGEVDLHLEARTPETAEWVDAAVAAGTLVNLGTTYETDEDFLVQKSANPSFVESYPELATMLQKMDTRSRSLGKTVIWAEKRGDVDGEEAAAYYMYTFDFEDRMKSWMPFEQYKTAKSYMENRYPDFRRCTNCPEADPDAPGSS